MPIREVMYRCEICHRLYPSESGAVVCEALSIPPWKIGDHIALNGEEPAAGMSGYVRKIMETSPHCFLAVLARTDSWFKHTDRYLTSGSWLVFIDRGEKIVPAPAGVTPAEPIWEKLPEWVREPSPEKTI